MSRVYIAIALLITAACGGAKNQSNAQAERDRKFQEQMTDVTLVGHSTRDNREGLFGVERYYIEKVSRLAGNTWLFQSRLQYENHDLPVPIPITIEWAGDTPVITMTDLTIPGVGTYTARVLLYRERYAGTWSGKNVGGQLFGKIVRGRQPSTPPAP